MSGDTGTQPLSISVVIPVYDGAATLPSLVDELARLRTISRTPEGREFCVTEVLLVWDHGKPGSDDAIRDLAAAHDWIRPIWLSRNYGQHAATLAGMTSSGGDWIVTLDEDGQMDPSYIGAMLDTAFDRRAQLVYGKPTNTSQHGTVRNLGSRMAKWVFVHLLADQSFAEFNSYRLVTGEIARSLAAYTGTGVYLDVALSWVVGDVAVCPVKSAPEGRPKGSYDYSRLISHFGRLIVSSGTKPLFFVTFAGFLFVVVGAVSAIWVLYRALTDQVPVSGWASMFIALMGVGGMIMVSLGIIAQYIGATTNMSLGRPLYVIVQDPRGRFGRGV